MKYTRISLFYLMGYLLLGGFGLLFFPNAMLNILYSNGEYSDMMVRLIGAFMIALGLVVSRTIQLRLVVLYSLTLVVRIFLVSVIGSFYLIYKDPMLLVLFVIVIIGVLLTSISYMVDNKRVIQSGGVLNKVV